MRTLMQILEQASLASIYAVKRKARDVCVIQRGKTTSENFCLFCYVARPSILALLSCLHITFYSGRKVQVLTCGYVNDMYPYA